MYCLLLLYSSLYIYGTPHLNLYHTIYPTPLHHNDPISQPDCRFLQHHAHLPAHHTYHLFHLQEDICIENINRPVQLCAPDTYLHLLSNTILFLFYNYSSLSYFPCLLYSSSCLIFALLILIIHSIFHHLPFLLHL